MNLIVRVMRNIIDLPLASTSTETADSFALGTWSCQPRKAFVLENCFLETDIEAVNACIVKLSFVLQANLLHCCKCQVHSPIRSRSNLWSPDW